MCLSLSPFLRGRATNLPNRAFKPYFHSRAMATATRQLPPWQQPWAPEDADLPPLRIWNSLTQTKTPFVPIDWKNKTVTWYTCGPTVYDEAHIGHARNYVTTDILRRIMMNYFSYKVKFVMNITDVDDKIIRAGRRQHLLAEFLDKATFPEIDTESPTLQALRVYVKNNLPQVAPETKVDTLVKEIQEKYKGILEGGPSKGGAIAESEGKLRMHIATTLSAATAITEMQKDKINQKEFYLKTQDVLMPYLDSLYGGTTNVDDHTIFTKLTRKYEALFMDDVRTLNCLEPDTVTRVTEYVDNIVDFVERIQKNGFAYTTSDGSVYFDIKGFEAAKYHYARLQPWNRNDEGRAAESEDKSSRTNSEKKSEGDFALWKSSKPGEPSWPSPWGKGRPGWHIECSAMASDVLGKEMDIHAGGIDLAFPHHDNELAQSEAFWSDKNNGQERQWVNYFIHMGHLHIEGLKMSKSLKNFTTIQEGLTRGDFTPRSLRIMCLLSTWESPIDLKKDLFRATSAWEEKITNFFIKTKDVIETRRKDDDITSPTDDEEAVVKALSKAQSDLHEALCDSFNTPLAMQIISGFVSAYNSVDESKVSVQTIKEIARWVTLLVTTFGLNGNAASGASPDLTIGWSGLEVPDIAKPFVYPLSKVRDELRRKVLPPNKPTVEELQPTLQPLKDALKQPDTNARPYATLVEEFDHQVNALSGSTNLSKDILQLCDRLRNVDLWNLGICLEDREGRPAIVRPVTQELIYGREEKDEREHQKQRAKEDREREAAAKVDKGRLSYLDMFRTKEYSAWDEEGMPVKDAAGEEITKSRQKKLRKDWERQKKMHEAWQKANSKGSSTGNPQ